MPTAFSHIAVPLALGIGLGRRAVSSRLLLAGLTAAVIPDLDVIAFRFGIPYADVFGHRGASHSLLFALTLGLIALLSARRLEAGRLAAFAFVAAGAASHGLLDMLTDAGNGVALWWPLSDERLFFGWRPIEASPISLRRLMSERGVEVLWSELVWVWLPAMTAAVLLAAGRRVGRRHEVG